MRLLASLALATVGFWLSACGSEAEVVSNTFEPVAIEDSDQCHLCGMIVKNFPGPKGQIAAADASQARKFCSTRDLLSYLLQPENRHLADRAFVHNMADANWQNPTDETFIPAKSAWYVIGSSRTGSMGPTLASFSKETSARFFAEQHGGELLTYEDLTSERLVNLTVGQVMH